MPGCFLSVRQACALTVLFAVSNMSAGGQGDGASQHAFPSAETLHYSIEWHLINAGNAMLRIEPSAGAKGPAWDVRVELQSIGVVSRLFKLDDKYTVHLEDQFCATASQLDAFEGKKHHDTKVTYDRAHGHATYVERDLLKNAPVSTKETPIPSCVADVIAGLYKLRTMQLQPGQSAVIPTSDGKKTAQVKVEAQEREEIRNHMGHFKTIRYEAYIFNGVIYSKKARMYMWLTDDAKKLPVQIRARMAFPIGSITLSLEKEDK